MHISTAIFVKALLIAGTAAAMSTGRAGRGGAAVLAARHPAPCPCKDASLCRPTTITHDREVFGFSVAKNETYDGYDWSQLTTVAWNEDPVLLCTAHAAGARVVLGAGASPAMFGNATARAAWIAERVRHAVEHHLDGINFDWEDPALPGDPLAQAYVALVAEAAEAFHTAIPGSQVSVDVPWSPYDVDGRNYDWQGLAQAADLLFVMAYDLQSQIWGSCVASANSPPGLVRKGLRQFLDAGVPRRKLVLGVPWYGYRYTCTNPAFAAGEERLCALASVPFRGCPCSDAAGAQLCYADIKRAIARGREHGGSGAVAARGASAQDVHNHAASVAGAGTAAAAAQHGKPHAVRLEGRLQEEESMLCEDPAFDELQGSPVTRCRQASNATGGFQVWFDDPRSLRLKYQAAAELGVRGVGVWHLDCLDYSCTTPDCQQDVQAMWAAVRAFTDGLDGSDAALEQ